MQVHNRLPPKVSILESRPRTQVKIIQQNVSRRDRSCNNGEVEDIPKCVGNRARISPCNFMIWSALNSTSSRGVVYKAMADRTGGIEASQMRNCLLLAFVVWVYLSVIANTGNLQTPWWENSVLCGEHSLVGSWVSFQRIGTGVDSSF